jgi:hypothetical protein
MEKESGNISGSVEKKENDCIPNELVILEKLAILLFLGWLKINPNMNAISHHYCSLFYYFQFSLI